MNQLKVQTLTPPCTIFDSKVSLFSKHPLKLVMIYDIDSPPGTFLHSVVLISTFNIVDLAKPKSRAVVEFCDFAVTFF